MVRLGALLLLGLGLWVGPAKGQGPWLGPQPTSVRVGPWANGPAQAADTLSFLPEGGTRVWRTSLWLDSQAVGRWQLVLQAGGGPITLYLNGRPWALAQNGSATLTLDSLATPPGWVQLWLEANSPDRAVALLTAVPSQAILRPYPALVVPAPGGVAGPLPPATYLLLLGLPLLLCVAWRLTDAPTFDHLFRLGVLTTRLHDSSRVVNLVAGVSSVWALVLRWALTAGVLCFVWAAFAPAPRWWVASAGVGTGGPGVLTELPFLALFGAAIVASLAVLVVRYGLLWAVSRAYRYRATARALHTLDTLASVPLLVGVYAVGLWPYLPKVPLGAGAHGTFGVLLVLYGGFHAWVLIRGLRGVIRLPWVGVAVYICVLEILPWFLLVAV